MSTSPKISVDHLPQHCDECKEQTLTAIPTAVCAARGCYLFLCQPCWRAHAVQHLLVGNGDVTLVMVEKYYYDIMREWGL